MIENLAVHVFLLGQGHLHGVINTGHLSFVFLGGLGLILYPLRNFFRLGAVDHRLFRHLYGLYRIHQFIQIQIRHLGCLLPLDQVAYRIRGRNAVSQ